MMACAGGGDRGILGTYRPANLAKAASTRLSERKWLLWPLLTCVDEYSRWGREEDGRGRGGEERGNRRKTGP